jgi:hypothetical protein
VRGATSGWCDRAVVLAQASQRCPPRRGGSAPRAARPGARAARSDGAQRRLLEADREVATILADLIVGGLLVTEVDAQADEPDREAGA